MIGTGTIINAIAIIVAGILGLFLGKYLKEPLQVTMLKSCGLGSFFIGVSGTIEKLLPISGEGLANNGILMMIISLCAGGFIGELIGIEQFLTTLGEWLKVKSHSTSDNSFINGFLTASLTVSIGAMAIIGPFNDALYHDYSILIAKSILDFVIVFVLSASYGKGCAFSVIPVTVIQGFFTLCALWLYPLLTEKALTNLSIVGNVIISGVGINLLFGKKIAVANLLPGLIIAVVWGLVTT